MVTITKQISKGYEQFRITLPAQLIRALGWKAGDELEPKIIEAGILLKKSRD